MNKETSEGSKPPAVPRRTQSAKILSSYKTSGRALKATNENEEQDPTRQPTRRLSQKNKTRRSLDAMEQQADELFDFLSDLETKKASCSDTDFLSFLSDTKSQTSSSTNNTKTYKKTSPTLPSRAKRVSVKDKAKLFLQSDIKEEPIEDTSKVNKSSATKKIQGSNRFVAVNQRNSSNNNNTDLESANFGPNQPNRNGKSTKLDRSKKSTVCVTSITFNEKTDLKARNSSKTTNVQVHIEKTENLQTRSNTKNREINGAPPNSSGDSKKSKSTVALLEYAETKKVIFSSGSSDSELSSEESESLSEAELSLESTPRSISPENQDEQDEIPNLPISNELRNSVSSPLELPSSISQDSENDVDFGSSEIVAEKDLYDSISPSIPSDEEFDHYYSSGVCFSCCLQRALQIYRACSARFLHVFCFNSGMACMLLWQRQYDICFELCYKFILMRMC